MALFEFSLGVWLGLGTGVARTTLMSLNIRALSTQGRRTLQCAGCARLVASHGPRTADAGRRSLIRAITDCAALGFAWAEVTRDPHQNRSV